MLYSIRKALVVSGLTLVVGPFCHIAQAQDYIDVEAERRARETAVQPVQEAPASRAVQAQSKPASAYPATSYGAGSGYSGAAAQPAPSPARSVSTSGDGGNIGHMLVQLQQLQQEVMRLNGQVEQQSHELRMLKEQQLERYVDIDRRLSALTMGGSEGSAAVSSNALASGSSGERQAIAANAGSEQPGEAAAYREAYALVRSQQFAEAVEAFKGFLRQFPAGRYAANAHYWLGELYLVVQPADLEASRQAFTLLLQEYPDNAKVPDALYKLGRVHFMKGNRERAREFLNRVISEFGGSKHSAAQLAQDFIDENY